MSDFERRLRADLQAGADRLPPYPDHFVEVRRRGRIRKAGVGVAVGVGAIVVIGAAAAIAVAVTGDGDPDTLELAVEGTVAAPTVSASDGAAADAGNDTTQNDRSEQSSEAGDSAVDPLPTADDPDSSGVTVEPDSEVAATVTPDHSPTDGSSDEPGAGGGSSAESGGSTGQAAEADSTSGGSGGDEAGGADGGGPSADVPPPTGGAADDGGETAAPTPEPPTAPAAAPSDSPRQADSARPAGPCGRPVAEPTVVVDIVDPPPCLPVGAGQFVVIENGGDTAVEIALGGAEDSRRLEPQERVMWSEPAGDHFATGVHRLVPNSEMWLVDPTMAGEVLAPDRLGPIVMGAGIGELEAIFGSDLALDGDPACGLAVPSRAVGGPASFALRDGRVAAITVTAPDIATIEGLTVGAGRETIVPASPGGAGEPGESATGDDSSSDGEGESSDEPDGKPAAVAVAGYTFDFAAERPDQIVSITAGSPPSPC